MNDMLTDCALVLALGAISLLMPPQAAGQTNTENFSQFKFNFNNPGARALGIGGAFISIADDATASEANPAGLTNLSRPEITFEFKESMFRREVSNYSHTGTAPNYTITPREFDNAVFSPAFVSVVMPFGKVVASLFRLELVNFLTEYYTKGSYVSTTDAKYKPVTSTLDMRVDNYGGAVAWKLSSRFSVGASFGLSSLSINSDLGGYLLELYAPGYLAWSATIDDNAFDFFVNVGAIFKPRNNLAIGAVYKRRPEFSVDHTMKMRAFPSDSLRVSQVGFNVPSAAGAGVSYNPSQVLTLSADAVYVFYSSLTKDMAIVMEPEVFSPSDFNVDDGVEFHIGLEYVLLLRSIGFVFRGGGYTERDNKINFVGNPSDNPADAGRTTERLALANLFRPGDDALHGTFGVGLIFSNKLQVDLAVDISDEVTTVAGSFGFRW